MHFLATLTVTLRKPFSELDQPRLVRRACSRGLLGCLTVLEMFVSAVQFQVLKYLLLLVQKYECRCCVYARATRNQVLSLLALLVQKYKYCCCSVLEIFVSGVQFQVLSLLGLLVQQDKY
jgi:hypothetical protein